MPAVAPTPRWDPPGTLRTRGSAHSFQKLEDGLPAVLRGVVQVLQPQLQLPPRVLEHARVPQDLCEQTAGTSAGPGSVGLAGWRAPRDADPREPKGPAFPYSLTHSMLCSLPPRRGRERARVLGREDCPAAARLPSAPPHTQETPGSRRPGLSPRPAQSQAHVRDTALAAAHPPACPMPEPLGPWGLRRARCTPMSTRTV